MSKTSQIKKRRRNFKLWWDKKHHHSPSHHWLTKHAKRVLYAYPMPASLFEDVQFILKRYNLSEHRRLKQCDAWTLYKVVYPTVTDSKKRMLALAERIDTSVQILKTLKAEAKGKYHPEQTTLDLKKLM